MSTGTMAHLFCEDFPQVADANLRAVVSREKSRGEAFAQKYGFSTVYESVSAMVEDPAIDVVYIATPHALHKEQALCALEAGKAVVCEKPITVNAKDCAEVQAQAKKSGSYLMEAMWTYFLPPMKKAKAWVDEGRIGELIHVKADFGNPVPYDIHSRMYAAELGGGCLLDMGVYPVAIAHYFFEQEPVSIRAMGYFAANGVETEVSALLRYGPEAHYSAVLGCSFRARLGSSAVVSGTKGYIVIPNAFRCQECFLYEGNELIEHFVDPRITRGYDLQVKSVCSDLRAGKKMSDVVPFQASYGFQRTMDAIRQAVIAERTSG
ncbi:MAG: Gfo/Idh/MocA family oxidoreductase [Myxococcales bacterium]|nr:Gfo/Idh/MocA family oxidoreductase [Myxococcales bacterium]